jgi:hypothetical protein
MLTKFEVHHLHIRANAYPAGSQNSSAYIEATRDKLYASIGNMIRKLKSGQFRLYSRKKDASSGKRRNLGTFATLEQAKQHEREVQYFKRH